MHLSDVDAEDEIAANFAGKILGDSSAGNEGGKPLTEEGDGGIMKKGEVEYGVPYGEYSLNAKMENINSDEYAQKYIDC